MLCGDTCGCSDPLASAWHKVPSQGCHGACLQVPNEWVWVCFFECFFVLVFVFACAAGVGLQALQVPKGVGLGFDFLVLVLGWWTRGVERSWL